LPTLTALVESN